MIIGISTDEQAELEAWKQTSGYPYKLASDPDHAVISAYGLWVARPWPPGQTTMMTARATILVSADGTVARVWENVDPASHARELVAALRA